MDELEASIGGICLQRGIGHRDGCRVVDANEPMLRSLTSADVPQCVALSTEAHWNQTALDWEFLIAEACPIGLFHPELGLVATTVAWDIPPGKTWINMVLVTESCRGRGYAGRLMKTAIEDAARRGLTAALDATVFGAPVYERMGFRGDDRVVRLKSPMRGDADNFVSEEAMSVTPMKSEDIPAVAALDFAVLGVERTSMLERWRQRLPSAAWCRWSADGDLIGFLLGREGRVATQLGPLVAQDGETAEALVRVARRQHPEPIFIDAPRTHSGWIEYLVKIGFTEERDFRRMATAGGQLATEWARYFAIAGPDFA